MKKYFLIATAITLLTTPAIAETATICYPPIEVQAEIVSQQIAQKVIDEYCNQLDPVSSEKGAIIIYYDRDANGECVAKVKVVK